VSFGRIARTKRLDADWKAGTSLHRVDVETEEIQTRIDRVELVIESNKRMNASVYEIACKDGDGIEDGDGIGVAESVGKGIKADDTKVKEVV